MTGYWKFNASLTNDTEYVNQLNQLLDNWVAEYNYITDKRVVWDLLKYEIRKFTCRYSSIKKKDENLEEQVLHKRLEELETALPSESGDAIDNEYYACKERLLELEEIKAKGVIIRSKVRWLEEGERCTQYFFGLETFNYNKKQIRKIIWIMVKQ